MSRPQFLSMMPTTAMPSHTRRATTPQKAPTDEDHASAESVPISAMRPTTSCEDFDVLAGEARKLANCSAGRNGTTIVLIGCGSRPPWKIPAVTAAVSVAVCAHWSEPNSPDGNRHSVS